jgi:hypothetical protein
LDRAAISGAVEGGEEQLHAVVEVVVEAFDRLDVGALVGLVVADVFFLGAHFLGEGTLHVG